MKPDPDPEPVPQPGSELGLEPDTETQPEPGGALPERQGGQRRPPNAPEAEA